MYRILTEFKNVDMVKSTLLGLGLDYTLYAGDGSWRGRPESSLVIELNDITRALAVRAAKSIKRINHQEAVLLQEIPVSSRLI
jgi:hypothetical protein